MGCLCCDFVPSIRYIDRPEGTSDPLQHIKPRWRGSYTCGDPRLPAQSTVNAVT